MRSGAWFAVILAACGGPASDVDDDLASPDAAVDPPIDAPSDAPPPWATYRIAPGQHSAMVENRVPRNPIDGVAVVMGRDYELAFDPSAMYVLTDPTDPADQFDWNKLPGLSDCNTVDLSVDGAMFGWRWRIDVEPPVLEIMAYANNARTHLWLDEPLFSLDADDLAAEAPLRYRVARMQDHYAFSVQGTIRGRAIDVQTTLPRRCTELERDPLAWAGAFYFGGTSVAPQVITAKMRETTYVD